MLKNFRLPFCLLCLVGLAVGALADTITLRTGERIEGRISAETETDITLQIQVSAGITDERVVNKADILKVDRIAPDELAFRAIMNLRPAQHSFQAAQYDQIIKALDAFAIKYPASTHRAAVLASMDVFSEEKARVAKGEVKLDGRWLTRDEALQQRVQIGGNQIFLTMKNASSNGDAIGALNAFATLEKNYPGARVMPDAVQLAQQVLAGFKPAVARALENQKVTKAERENGFAAASPAYRKELMDAYQREQMQAEAALTAATAAGQWPPMIPGSEKCLTALQAKIVSETKRLADLPVAAMRDSLRLVEKAQGEYAESNPAAALETLREATGLWAANDLANQLKTQIANPKAPPKLDPGSKPAATPPPAATPVVKTPPATPKAATPAPEPPPPPQETAEEVKPVQPEPKPFFRTLGGAITIVVVLALILAGANIFNHLRSRTQDAEE